MMMIADALDRFDVLSGFLKGRLYEGLLTCSRVMRIADALDRCDRLTGSYYRARAREEQVEQVNRPSYRLPFRNRVNSSNLSSRGVLG